MEVNNLLKLFQELSDKNFWGSVKINFQEGQLVNLEVVQTIKNIGISSMVITKIKKSDVTIRENVVFKKQK